MEEGGRVLLHPNTEPASFLGKERRASVHAHTYDPCYYFIALRGKNWEGKGWWKASCLIQIRPLLMMRDFLVPSSGYRL